MTSYNYQVVAFNQSGQAASSEISVLAGLTGTLLKDDFDPGLDFTVWSVLSGGQAQSGPVGFLTGKAFYFSSSGARNATTVPSDLTYGGSLNFQFRAGNEATQGLSVWNNSEGGENVVVEYSVNGGATWQILATLQTQYPANSTWTRYSLVAPVAARTSTTSFRWRQLANSGANTDHWALDDVEIVGVVAPPPEAPPFISVTANSSRVVAVSWIGSPDTTSYSIERRTPNTDWVEVGVAATFQTYFTDATASPATSYSYRVKAVNAGGSSAPSQTAFVTTWSTLQEWRFQNYGTLANSGAAADLADNGTGVPNLLKYAFNMAQDDSYFQVTPGTGSAGMPFVRMESSSNRLQIAFIRRRAENSPGIQYLVEFSHGISSWAPGGVEILAAPIDEYFEYVVWEDDVDPADSPKGRFARIRVVGN